MKSLLRTCGQARESQTAQSWGSLQWLASSGIGNSDHMTLGRVIIKRGYSNPRHSHPGCDEILHLLRGRLQHSLGSDTVKLDAGDTLVIERGVAHNAVSVGDEDAEMIVAYPTGHRDFRPETAADGECR
ncbi:MAG: cupin domain-containing protein [bacterium]|nr:cupin domain-containing protein [Candidatus Sumerlaeota bacterium]